MRQSEPRHIKAHTLGLAGCHVCGAVCRVTSGRAARCPRCGARVALYRPYARHYTWALLLTAIVLYIPANIIPVMYTGALFAGQDNTIVGGVIDLWRSGSIDLAVIVFLASVVVPVLKFIALGYLLLTTGRHASHLRRRQQTRLYQLVERIGYWSMLDVFVVALLTGAVQLEPFASIRPMAGITWFALVVVLTMLAAAGFDPKSIWNDGKEQ